MTRNGGKRSSVSLGVLTNGAFEYFWPGNTARWRIACLPNCLCNQITSLADSSGRGDMPLRLRRVGGLPAYPTTGTHCLPPRLQTHCVHCLPIYCHYVAPNLSVLTMDVKCVKSGSCRFSLCPLRNTKHNSTELKQDFLRGGGGIVCEYKFEVGDNSYNAIHFSPFLTTANDLLDYYFFLYNFLYITLPFDYWKAVCYVC